MAIQLRKKTPYDRAFYDLQQEGSYRSASVIVPLILSLYPFESVVDVGCGVGTWCGKFLEEGVLDVIGVDGEYIDRAMLRIPRDRFTALDLGATISLGRRFDLAACLEVGEHLDEERSPGLIGDLTSLAPCVLFSAAMPGQGGTDHINERYLSEWATLFAEHQFVPLDIVRHQIWKDRDVDWWYRQNIILFAHRTHRLAQTYPASTALDYVHPELYEIRRQRSRLSKLFHAVPGSRLVSERLL